MGHCIFLSVLVLGGCSVLVIDCGFLFEGSYMKRIQWKCVSTSKTNVLIVDFRTVLGYNERGLVNFSTLVTLVQFF